VLDVIATYFGLLASYPWAFASVATDQPLWLSAWLIVGVIALVLARRSRIVTIGCLALWFLPGTVICGSAMLVPLPYAVAAALGPGKCAGPASLAICIVLNAAIVVGLAWLLQRMRSRPVRA